MTEPVEAAPLRRIPLVPLRDDVVFPKLIVPLSVGRRTSIAAITFAMEKDKQVLLVAQKDPQTDETAEADLYATGTIADINGMRQTPAGVQMLVAGTQRARIVRFTQFTPFIEVEVEPVLDEVGAGLELEAHMCLVESLLGKRAPAIELELPLGRFQTEIVSGRTPTILAVSLREWPCACRNAARRARAEKLRRDP